MLLQARLRHVAVASTWYAITSVGHGLLGVHPTTDRHVGRWHVALRYCSVGLGREMCIRGVLWRVDNIRVVDTILVAYCWFGSVETRLETHNVSLRYGAGSRELGSYLDQILSLCFRDKRLQFRRREGVD